MITNVAEIKPAVHTNGQNGFHKEHELLIPPDFKQAFADAHPGFVPSAYPTDRFGDAVKYFLTPEDAPENDSLIDTNVAAGERASYNGHWSPYEDQLMKMVTRTGVYNIPEYEGQPYTLVIQHEAAEVAQEAAREALKASNVEVVLPFATEPESIQGVTEYAAARVGMNRVHPIDAGIDVTSAQLARETGAEVAHQPSILKHIDLDLLRREGIIPAEIEQLKGSKGLTMYAALLKLEAMGRLDDSFVIFHDTDIINPGSKDDTRGSEEDYAALDYIGIPLAFPVGEMNAVHIAKTGSGRNNESWIGEVGHHLNDDDAQIRNLAHHIAPTIWPLTGERGIKGSLLKQIPMPTDMNVETMLDVAVCGVDARTGKRGLMQVANSTPKIENRTSPEDREWGMLYACEAGLKTYFQTVRQTGKYPHEWDAEVVGIYNMMYGNKRYRAPVKDNHLHRANKIIPYRRGILMPSIQQLKGLNAVDWDGIRREIGVK